MLLLGFHSKPLSYPAIYGMLLSAKETVSIFIELWLQVLRLIQGLNLAYLRAFQRLFLRDSGWFRQKLGAKFVQKAR